MRKKFNINWWVRHIGVLDVCVCLWGGGGGGGGGEGVIHSKLMWVLGVTKEYLTELPTFDPMYQK